MAREVRAAPESAGLECVKVAALAAWGHQQSDLRR